MIVKKNRVLYLEFIRIISCFLVIVNHTNSSIFLSQEPSLTWFLSLTYFFISKPAVPLFLMVSGVTLLGRDEPIHILLKRILRIIIVTIVFSFIYYVNNEGISNLSFLSILTFLVNVIGTPRTNAFWYLYLYIGVLIIMPLLRKLIIVIEKELYYYFFCVFLLFPGVYPIVNHYFPVVSISPYVLVPFFSIYIAIIILGYYLHMYATISKRKRFVAVSVYLILLILQVVGTHREYLKNSESYLFFDDRTFATITISAACVFYISKCFFTKMKKIHHCKFITELGQCTFGIYLFSDLLIERLQSIRVLLDSVLHPICAVIIYQVLIFSIGFVFTYILRKIRIFKKYI